MDLDYRPLTQLNHRHEHSKSYKMDNEYDQLPNEIFSLSYKQHRVNKVSRFLTYNNVKFNKKARKAKLLHHLAELEKTFQKEEEKDGISHWFRTGHESSELDTVIGEKSPGSSIELDCSICMESFPIHQFPHKKLAAGCNHQPSTCLACLKQSLKQQTEDIPWDQIACPECPERLTFEVVKEFATKEVFER